MKKSLLYFGLLLTFAFAEPYTVQVAALSDQDAVLKLRNDLVNQGYPAYIVSASTDQGNLLRVRVGAFANREAAAAFSKEMSEGTETTPIPVLLSAIPEGFIPLLAELIVSYPYFPGITSIRIVAWGQERALRFQGSYEGEWLEAEYRVLSPDFVNNSFSAWRAAPSEDGSIVRVYSTPLWPDYFSELSASALTKEESRALATVAGDLELRLEEIEEYTFFAPGTGKPYLVRAERLNLKNGLFEKYPVLGDNNGVPIAATGPDLVWFDRAYTDDIPKGMNTVILDLQVTEGLSSNTPTIHGSLQGKSWTAIPDGKYTTLHLKETGQAWRVVAGTPRWAYEDYLLVQQGNELVLYSFALPE